MSSTTSGATLAIRRVSVIVAAGILAIFVVRTSMARVVDTADPSLALSLNPNDARAMAAMAEVIAKPDATVVALAQASKLARSALIRDGTIAPAMRTLGLAADLNGNRAKAAALFSYAAITSSRDLPAQLWLIQQAVDKDDSAGALDHFDIALRSSHRSATLLFPILVGATEDDRLLKPISDVLSRRPWWGNGYLVNLVTNGKAIANIVGLFGNLNKQGTPVSVEAATLLVNRLVREGRFGDAWAIHKRMFPNTQIGVLQNSKFENDPAPTAFDWTLSDKPDLLGERTSGSNGSIALSFHAASGFGGTVARQLVILSPGKYRISGISKNAVPGKISPVGFTVSCADTATGGYGVLSAESQNDRTEVSFSVPTKNCNAVWIDLRVTASDVGIGVDGEIDDITLVALSK
jgi:hypothetical protein